MSNINLIYLSFSKLLFGMFLKHLCLFKSTVCPPLIYIWRDLPSPRETWCDPRLQDARFPRRGARSLAPPKHARFPRRSLVFDACRSVGAERRCGSRSARSTAKRRGRWRICRASRRSSRCASRSATSSTWSRSSRGSSTAGSRWDPLPIRFLLSQLIRIHPENFLRARFTGARPWRPLPPARVRAALTDSWMSRAFTSVCHTHVQM